MAEERAVLLDDEEALSVIEEEFLNLDKEAQQEKLAQERVITELARRPLQIPNWKSELETLSMEGELFKRQNKSSKWTKSYFLLIPEQLHLIYFKTKEERMKQKNGTSIPVSWIRTDKANEDDKLSKKQMEESVQNGKIQVCTYRVTVYSPKRIYVLSASSDEEMVKWASNIQQLLTYLFTKEEREAKERAAVQLGSLQNKHLKLEREQYKFIIQSLQTADLFPERPVGKKREGYLELQKPDGSWKKYYFMLFKESLTYFNLSDKLLPRGVILLDSITSIRILPESTKNDDRPKQTDKEDRPPKQPFIIHTALRTYFLRAKHKEAMKDWIIIIQQLRSHEKALVGEAVIRNQDEVEGESILGPKRIEYEFEGKKKTYKMKKSSIVIGRSSKAEIYVNDAKMSRNHCRIEMSAAGVPVLYDLGSLGGTLVNSKKVIKVALKSGDQIQCGHTKITFIAD